MDAVCSRGCGNGNLPAGAVALKKRKHQVAFAVPVLSGGERSRLDGRVFDRYSPYYSLFAPQPITEQPPWGSDSLRPNIGLRDEIIQSQFQALPLLP